MVKVCCKCINAGKMPRGHTYEPSLPDECELCPMTDQELKEYINFRNIHLW